MPNNYLCKYKLFRKNSSMGEIHTIFFSSILLIISIILPSPYAEKALALENPLVLINEILPNPIGSDKGKEWIELYNPSNKLVDISNWEIQVAGTHFSTLFKLPQDTIILPYSFYCICGSQINNLCDYSHEKLSIQNGGSETDGVRIIDNQGNVIDTILYDYPNNNGLIDDFGIIAIDSTLAPKVPEGYSLARKTSNDTNNSHDDFIILSQPTLGFHNNIVKQDKIHLSEISTHQGWIELHASSPLTEVYYISSSIDDHREKILIPIESPYPLFTIDIKSLICYDKKSNNICIEPQSLETNTCINLSNSSDQIVDTFCFNSSHTYSRCRILNEDLNTQRFSICEPTRDQANIPLSFSYTTFRDIRNATGLFNESFVKACPITTYQGITVFYDGDSVFFHNDIILSGACVHLSLYKYENGIKINSILSSIDRSEVILAPKVNAGKIQAFNFVLIENLIIDNLNGRLSTSVNNETVIIAQDDSILYEQLSTRFTQNKELNKLKVSNLEAIVVPFSTDSLNSTKLALIPLKMSKIEEISVPDKLASTGVHFSYTLMIIIVIMTSIYFGHRRHRHIQE